MRISIAVLIVFLFTSASNTLGEIIQCEIQDSVAFSMSAKAIKENYPQIVFITSPGISAYRVELVLGGVRPEPFIFDKVEAGFIAADGKEVRITKSRSRTNWVFGQERDSLTAEEAE